jgi:hypothetical protein
MEGLAPKAAAATIMQAGNKRIKDTEMAPLV